MGIVLELYRVEDKVIDYYIQHAEIEQINKFFDKYFHLVGARFFDVPERFYYTDKAWDVGIYLLRECDTTENKVLNGLKGHKFIPMDFPAYIKSVEAKEISEALEKINEEELKKAYVQEKMLALNIYGAQGAHTSNWNYHLENTKTIISAFKAAKKYGHGIVLYFS